jgi:hypothetical protein
MVDFHPNITGYVSVYVHTVRTERFATTVNLFCVDCLLFYFLKTVTHTTKYEFIAVLCGMELLATSQITYGLCNLRNAKLFRRLRTSTKNILLGGFEEIQNILTSPHINWRLNSRHRRLEVKLQLRVVCNFVRLLLGKDWLHAQDTTKTVSNISITSEKSKCH